MDTIEGHTEADLVQVIRQVIENDLATAPRISAKMVADVAYKRLDFENTVPHPLNRNTLETSQPPAPLKSST